MCGYWVHMALMGLKLEELMKLVNIDQRERERERLVSIWKIIIIRKKSVWNGGKHNLYALEKWEILDVTVALSSKASFHPNLLFSKTDN